MSKTDYAYLKELGLLLDEEYPIRKYQLTNLGDVKNDLIRANTAANLFNQFVNVKRFLNKSLRTARIFYLFLT